MPSRRREQIIVLTNGELCVWCACGECVCGVHVVSVCGVHVVSVCGGVCMSMCVMCMRMSEIFLCFVQMD